METPSRVESTPQSSSWPRALGAAYGMGLLGAILAGIFGLIGVLISMQFGLPVTLRLVLLLILGQYVAFIGPSLAYLRYRGFDADDIRAYFGLSVPSLKELGIALAGFITMLVLVMGIAVIVQMLNAQPAPNQSTQQAQEIPRLIPIFIVASIFIIGPSEETLFRGIVQNRLREALSAPVAIGLAAVLFASIHYVALTGGGGGRIVTVGILLIPSLVFGVVYEYTENLVVPALIHGVWNAMIFSLIWASLQFSEMQALLF